MAPQQTETWQARFARGAATPWMRTLAVLWIAQVVSELAFSFALPFVPLYIQELGVSAKDAGVWAGFMAGLFALTQAAMGPIWGTLADRFGRRVMIQRALVGGCLVIGGMSLVQSPEQLLILRILQGSVTGVVAAAATVVSLTVPRRHLGTSLGLMQAAMFAGSSLGPIVGGAFSDRFGLRAAFGATSLLFLFCAALVTLFVAEPVREAPRPTGVGAASADRGLGLSKLHLFAIVGLTTVVRIGTNAPTPVLPLWIQQMDVDPAHVATTVGFVLAATGIASTISALVVGRLADRYGRRATLVTCLIGAALICIPHAFVTTVSQLVILRLAAGLAIGGMNPAIQALLTDLTPPDRRATAFGLLSTAQAIGNGVGPVGGSLIAASFGVPTVFLASVPVFALGSLLVARLPPAVRRPAG